jgi:hypothetical protein
MGEYVLRENKVDTYLSLTEAMINIEDLFDSYFSDTYKNGDQFIGKWASSKGNVKRLREVVHRITLLKRIIKDEKMLLGKIAKYNESIISSNKPVIKNGPNGADPATEETIRCILDIGERFERGKRDKLYSNKEISLLETAINSYVNNAQTLNNFLVEQNKKDVQREKLLLIFTEDGSLSNVSGVEEYKDSDSAFFNKEEGDPNEIITVVDSQKSKTQIFKWCRNKSNETVSNAGEGKTGFSFYYARYVFRDPYLLDDEKLAADRSYSGLIGVIPNGCEKMFVINAIEEDDCIFIVSVCKAEDPKYEPFIKKYENRKKRLELYGKLSDSSDLATTKRAVNRYKELNEENKLRR